MWLSTAPWRAKQRPKRQRGVASIAAHPEADNAATAAAGADTAFGETAADAFKAAEGAEPPQAGRRRLRRRRSTNESSSGSSDDSKLLRPPASGAASVASLPHDVVAALTCTACQTKGHHGILALAFGGDANMAEAFVAKIEGKRKGDKNWRLRARDIIIPAEARFRVPGDGNCLFSAVGVAYYLASRPDDNVVPSRAQIGNLVRTKFLAWASKQLDESACLMGAPLSALLIDPAGRWKTADEYVKGMALPVISRCQWGGFPEFCALAKWLKLRVWCFVEFQDKSVKLLCEPIGSSEDTPISLLWCGGCHYDACRLSTHQLNESLL
jgi:hypothetical protein